MAGTGLLGMTGNGVIKVQVGDGHYRLVGPGGEEGELVELGEIADLKLGGEEYVSLLFEDEETGELVTDLSGFVVRQTEVPSQMEEVDFDLQGAAAVGDGDGDGEPESTTVVEEEEDGDEDGDGDEDEDGDGDDGDDRDGGEDGEGGDGDEDENEDNKEVQ